ncbi:NADH-quinone oxidoreductase subunit NuoG [Thiomonas sp. FB-Cd]|uniref:NADH-quinone oxidoreductase subunit NuoG n=1 Tax=Thiomonas sp. FB-Cd TaxID=1158292 RepID=UPI0004DF91FF|nr:NADH-quinone oxidoreductase subunit NuoG [Thiomonas sp. FB-Cd]
MVELEIDGRKVEVPEGSMVMEAAHKLDIYVPHFCYHPKLSIAANCRMCLVDIEKAPKPLPACATPVAQGMIVRTHSDKALQAQKGVMELLLINHPLDCPICDQGGECQLQDLAVGYGASTSRYHEDKRVVFHKNAGPLIAMEEMTRCIHCTRCVRFGQEVAGVMELGMAMRGEHSEITTFLEGSIDSELSGNMIDICPVGALTSKPFRFAARTWELTRRASVSPHDSLGTNLVMQVKNNRVMRVVPQENENINECWISDRDRFSYEGLNSSERLTQPMIRDGDQWRDVDWPTALSYVANGLKRIIDAGGPGQLGALASPVSTVEELFLVSKLVRALGSESVDFRLRQSDFSQDGDSDDRIPSLGLPVADVRHLQSALIVGSLLRKDHPLLAAKLRRASKSGGKISVVHAADDDLLMPLHARLIAPPSAWVNRLAEVAACVADQAGVARPQVLEGMQPSEDAQRIAQSLLSGERKAVLLGNAAAQHPHARDLDILGRWIAEHTGASFGYTVEAANTVGAYLVGAKPGSGGLNVAQMVQKPPAAMLLLGVEPEFDMQDGAAAAAAMRACGFVVALSAYRGTVADYAQVLLPIAPFSETAGAIVNCEGSLQTYSPVVGPVGQSRPAWKVLRVLADQLGLPGFEYDTVEAVRDAALHGVNIAERLQSHTGTELPASLALQGEARGLSDFERLAEVPIYFSDAIVRRAASLQQTRDARLAGQIALAPDAWQRLGLQSGDRVKVQQGAATTELSVRLDNGLATGVVRIAAAHPATVGLGPMFGAVSVHKA